MWKSLKKILKGIGSSFKEFDDEENFPPKDKVKKENSKNVETTSSSQTANTQNNESANPSDSNPLTKEQKKKEKEIDKEYKTNKKRIESDSTISAEDKKTQLKAAKKIKESKLKEILTPEQFVELKKKSKNKKKNNE